MSTHPPPPHHLHHRLPLDPLLAQVKDVLSKMYAHVAQLGAGPVAAGGGDEDGEKDEDDTAYVSDKFLLLGIK